LANGGQGCLGARSGSAQRCWSKGGGQGIEAELAVQVAARAEIKFVKTSDGAENPGGVDGLAERIQLFCEGSIPQGGLFQFGRKFEEIGEQAVENADLIFEGGDAVFREGRSGGEELAGVLGLRGAF